MDKKEEIICQCGNVFIAYKCLHRKFCSHKCALDYNLKFLIPFQFKNGFKPHNKNKKGYRNKGTFKSGKSHLNYKHGIYQNNNVCIDCGKKISRTKAIRCDICNSKYYSGNMHPMFGRIFKANHTFYKKIYFRSSWEANFAKWCDLSGIKWSYEHCPFELLINGKETTYTPDFYLPEFDIWIEVKGRWIRDAKLKFESFKKQHSDYHIELFEKDRLKQFGIIK